MARGGWIRLDECPICGSGNAEGRGCVIRADYVIFCFRMNKGYNSKQVEKGNFSGGFREVRLKNGEAPGQKELPFNKDATSYDLEDEPE